jgi:hypothetical protein
MISAHRRFPRRGNSAPLASSSAGEERHVPPKKKPSLKSIPKRKISDETAGQLKGGMMRKDDTSTQTRDQTEKNSEVDEG